MTRATRDPARGERRQRCSRAARLRFAAVLVAVLPGLLAPTSPPPGTPTPPGSPSAPEERPGPSLDQEIDAKLERQIFIFERMRGSLAGSDRIGERAMPRGEWEALISLPPAEAFSDEELRTIAAVQEAAIEVSRMRARASSSLDLDRVRAAGAAREFCRAMPKGGLLHVHPNGTLDRATLESLIARSNPWLDRNSLLAAVPERSRAEAGERLGFLDAYDGTVLYASLSSADRERALDLFFWKRGTRTSQLGFAMVKALRRSFASEDAFDIAVLRRFFERARAHRVSYVELSRSLEPKGATVSLLAEIDVIARNHGIHARYKIGLSRTDPIEQNAKRVRGWMRRHDAAPLVLGVDLHGDERAVSSLEAMIPIYPDLVAARQRGQAGLRRTAHAAGLGQPDNPRDALLLGAERLGHGVSLRRDPVALEWARRLRVPIEINLTSNEVLGYVESIETHPFLDFLRLGLPVSLSTDHEGMLDTDISRECQAAVERTDVSWAELARMARNSIATSFARPTTAGQLARRLEQDLRDFEAEWSRYAPLP